MNIYDLISRAQKLRKETQLDSVSPDRVGGLHEDTLKYINEFQLLASSPSLHKIYASVSAMQSDKSPKSDLTGKPLKPGQLVVIVPANQTDATAGDVYRYDGPSGNTSAWTFVAKIGAVPADAELSATSTNPPQNKVVTEKLTELESRVTDNIDYYSPRPRSTDFVNGKYVAESGAIADNSQLCCTVKALKVIPGQRIVLECNQYVGLPVISMYDGNMKLVNVIKAPDTSYRKYDYTVKAGEAFVRFSCYKGTSLNIQYFPDTYAKTTEDGYTRTFVLYIQNGTLNYGSNPKAIMISNIIPLSFGYTVDFYISRPLKEGNIYQYLYYYTKDKGLSDTASFTRASSWTSSSPLLEEGENGVIVCIREYNPQTDSAEEITIDLFKEYSISYTTRLGSTGGNNSSYDTYKHIEIEKKSGYYKYNGEFVDSEYYNHSQVIELPKDHYIYCSSISVDGSVSIITLCDAKGFNAKATNIRGVDPSKPQEIYWKAEEDCYVILSFKPENVGYCEILYPFSERGKAKAIDGKIIGAVWFDGWGGTRASWIADAGLDEDTIWKAEHPIESAQYEHWWEWAEVKEGYVIPRQVSYDMYFAKRGVNNKPLRGWRYDSIKDFEDDVRLAEKTGLDYFACCFYPRFTTDGHFDKIATEEMPANRWINWAKDSEYLTVAHLKVACVLANSIETVDGLDECLDYLANTIIRHRNYLYINNRPAIFALPYTDLFFNENVKDVFEGNAVKNGLANYYIIFQHYSQTIAFADAVFNYAPDKFGEKGAITYKEWTDKIISASYNTYPQIKTIGLGWDRRNTDHTDEGFYVTDYSNAVFKEQLYSVAESMQNSNKDRILLLYAWNELGEGGWLLPTVSDENGERLQTLSAFITKWKKM